MQLPCIWQQLCYHLSTVDFKDKLIRASRQNRSWLCIGLDPDPDLMPGVDVTTFNKAIIDATSDLVCAYKPNFAFYEALGRDGMNSLLKTIESVPSHMPVIGDAKRSDVGNTAKAYAKALFKIFGCDAATVSPYLGFDSIEPFIQYKDKGVFILCRTSNAGAADFQSLSCGSGSPLYEMVALKAREWNKQGNIGLVAGATAPEELGRIRELCPNMPILIPGVGTQGGDMELAVSNGADNRGECAIINVSRKIIYASAGRDYAQASRNAAKGYRDAINAAIARQPK